MINYYFSLKKLNPGLVYEYCKMNDCLSIIENLDDIKHNIPSNAYLKICNNLKNIYTHIECEKMMKYDNIDDFFHNLKSISKSYIDKCDSDLFDINNNLEDLKQIKMDSEMKLNSLLEFCTKHKFNYTMKCYNSQEKTYKHIYSEIINNVRQNIGNNAHLVLQRELDEHHRMYLSNVRNKIMESYYDEYERIIDRKQNLIKYMQSNNLILP